MLHTDRSTICTSTDSLRFPTQVHQSWQPNRGSPIVAAPIVPAVNKQPCPFWVLLGECKLCSASFGCHDFGTLSLADDMRWYCDLRHPGNTSVLQPRAARSARSSCMAFASIPVMNLHRRLSVAPLQPLVLQWLDWLTMCSSHGFW